MKLQTQLLRFGFAGLIATTLPFFMTPATFASFLEKEELQLAQFRQERPQVNLNLVVDKQEVTVDENGVEQVRWENVGDQVTVVPGDTLRYVVMGTNEGGEAANNLTVTQPIPQQMVYVLGSANSSNNAVITYSINNGETFVANPTIKVEQPDGTVVEKPAPASAYTHIRWDFPSAIAPEDNLEAMYVVEVE
ncbi:MAG: DUF11 domain-containing protein [Cyanobacteria bacterium]|jgi:uncharacterized repeat protein (TIGR01451 family)|nr:DUF11 domain-containing protein [Cyanobacteria bacterium GSL.Bin1]